MVLKTIINIIPVLYTFLWAIEQGKLVNKQIKYISDFLRKFWFISFIETIIAFPDLFVGWVGEKERNIELLRKCTFR